MNKIVGYSIYTIWSYFVDFYPRYKSIRLPNTKTVLQHGLADTKYICRICINLFCYVILLCIPKLLSLTFTIMPFSVFYFISVQYCIVFVFKTLNTVQPKTPIKEYVRNLK